MVRSSRIPLAGLCLALWMVLLFNALTVSAKGFKSAPGNGVPDVYTVVLAEGVASKPRGPRQGLPTVAQVAQELGRQYNGQDEEIWEHALQFFVVRMPEALALKLAEDPRVLAVEQDYAISAPVGDCYYGTSKTDTRPLPSSTVSPQGLSCADPDPLHDPNPTGPPLCVDNWGIDRIDQPSARNNFYFFTNNGRNTATTVHIYVMDSGIRRTHRELRAASGLSRVVGGVDARNNPPDDSPTADTSDCHGHGTHVAGIIAGRTYGVAKDAILHPVRILGCPPSGATMATTARGLNWISANAQFPAVINWSGGNNPSFILDTTLFLAVKGVLDQGIILVQAAGNQSHDYDPAEPLNDACDWSFGEKHPAVIVAGGIDEYDGRWTRRPPELDPDDGQSCPTLNDCGSNAGSCVDIWAPAAHVVSSDKDGDNLTCRLSGTSMAAPHVTGVVALYLEDHPNATSADVDKALRSRGTWNALESSAADPNYIGPGSDNVLLNADTLSLGPDLAPTATFNFTCLSRLCTFDGTGSTDDFGIASYVWDFGDDSSPASGSIVQHAFPQYFLKRVTLRVTDGLGRTDHFSKVVNATNDTPVPCFTYDCPSRTCSFNAACSTDNQEIRSWTWDFGDGTGATGQAPVHTYGGTGSTFQVTLTVADALGEPVKTQKTVSIAVDTPPTAQFTFTCSLLTCSFNASSSTDDHGIASYSWSFGDSTPNGTGVTTSHLYPSVTGTNVYMATLTVTDSLGQQSSRSRKVSVSGDPIAPAESYFAVAPCRILDTRNTTILTSNQPRIINIAGSCGIPSTAKAVSFNASAISPTGGGKITLYPGNLTASWSGERSSLNFAPATSPRANSAVIQLATNGSGTLGITAVVSGSPGQVHLVLDVEGYFSTDTTPAPGAQGPLGFQTLPICRMVDTRPSSPLVAGTVRTFTAQGVCGVPVGAAAASMHIGVTAPASGGYIRVYPSNITMPPVSSINFNSGISALRNSARVNLSPTTPDFAAYFGAAAGASVHATFDVNGYFKSDAPLKYHPIAPCRAVDTADPAMGGPALAADVVRTFQIQGNCGVPAGARAVVVRSKISAPTSVGVMSVYPSNLPLPPYSTIQFDANEPELSMGAIVPLSNLAEDLAVSPNKMTAGATVHLLIDVFGYFQ